MSIISTPQQIEAYRLLTIKAALGLEAKGLRMGRGKSALSMVKAMGIKARTAKQAYPLFVAHLQSLGLLPKESVPKV